MTGNNIKFEDYLEISNISPSGLVWKTNTSSRTVNSTKAGWLDTSNGYWKVELLGKNYYAHRIIYILATAQNLEDDLQIDHIDGNRSNNSISNLRKVDNLLNSKNIRKRITNKSGVTGISYDSAQDRWVVRWVMDGVRKTKTFPCRYGTELAFNKAKEFNMQVRLLLVKEYGYTGRNNDF